MRNLLREDMAKAGYKCPMCGSKDFAFCYHDHQIMDSAICNKCGIRWTEDNDRARIWREWYEGKFATPEEFIKELTYYRKNRPAKDGIYQGLKFGGFVWVLHKTGEYFPVQDSRSSDEVDFKHFGLNPKNRKTRR